MGERIEEEETDNSEAMMYIKLLMMIIDVTALYLLLSMQSRKIWILYIEYWSY